MIKASVNVRLSVRSSTIRPASSSQISLTIQEVVVQSQEGGPGGRGGICILPKSLFTSAPARFSFSICRDEFFFVSFSFPLGFQLLRPSIARTLSDRRSINPFLLTVSLLRPLRPRGYPRLLSGRRWLGALNSIHCFLPEKPI